MHPLQPVRGRASKSNRHTGGSRSSDLLFKGLREGDCVTVAFSVRVGKKEPPVAFRRRRRWTTPARRDQPAARTFPPHPVYSSYARPGCGARTACTPRYTPLAQPRPPLPPTNPPFRPQASGSTRSSPRRATTRPSTPASSAPAPAPRFRARSAASSRGRHTARTGPTRAWLRLRRCGGCASSSAPCASPRCSPPTSSSAPPCCWSPMRRGALGPG
eukprot:scaffold18130_cov119-Isochrysis_galbana.AAC.6